MNSGPLEFVKLFEAKLIGAICNFKATNVFYQMIKTYFHEFQYI